MPTNRGVPVVDVRVVRVAVRQRFVIVGVRVGLARGGVGPVRMLVMFVVAVRMTVC